MKIVENWRVIWKHYSTVALTAVSVLPGIWAANPEIHALIPAEYLAVATAIIAVIGLIGKYVQQGKPNDL